MNNKKTIQSMVVYQFLKDNCVGKDKAMSGNSICDAIMSDEKKSKYFDNISSRKLRKIINKLRRNEIENKTITRHIGSNRNGYWLELEKENGIEYLKKLAKSTLESAIKSGVPKEYFYQILNNLKVDYVSNNQMRFKLKPNQKDIVKVFSDDIL